MNTFIPADTLSLGLFTAFSGLMFAGIFSALLMASRKSAVFFSALILIFGLIVWSDVPRQYLFPAMPLLFASIIVLSIGFAFSNLGLSLGIALPLWVLIGFQAFRLPLELILHQWAEIGTVPPTMTWSGQNIDIISGIVAALSAPFVERSKSVAWIANTVGTVLLLNVLRVVVMSAPFPFSWPLERPLVLIAFMPYALIGPLFVAPAIIGHLIAFRVLLR